MTEELNKLLALYSALQECAPNEQAARQVDFKNAIKATAAKHRLDHWRVTAYVIKQWEVMVQKEEKRKALEKSKGLSLEEPNQG